MKTTRIMSVAAVIVAAGLALHTAQAPGIMRTDLQQHDLSVPGREVVQVRVDFAPGVLAPAHKHRNSKSTAFTNSSSSGS
jgi:quercetin dioxygenase-like cupin family protein